jgi:crossover junction endodeoxyribonuclease RusA
MTAAARPFFSVTVEGTPVPKGRPRIGKSGHVYTPGATRVWEITIQLATRVAMMGRSPTTLPCVVHVAAILEYPASVSQKKARELLEEGGIHAIKPDLDNLLKAALDGISGATMAVYDDKQIIEVCCYKRYGPRACLMIDVFEIDDDDSAVDRFANRWRAWENNSVAVSPI